MAGIHATGSLKVRVGGTLYLIGSVLDGPPGATDVSAKELRVVHLKDSEDVRSFSIDANLPGDRTAWEGKDEAILGDVDLDFRPRQFRGTTQATLSPEANIQVEKVTASLRELNRDMSRVQTTEVDENTHLRAFVPFVDVKEIARDMDRLSQLLERDSKSISSQASPTNAVPAVDAPLPENAPEDTNPAVSQNPPNTLEVVPGGDFHIGNGEGVYESTYCNYSDNEGHKDEIVLLTKHPEATTLNQEQPTAGPVIPEFPGSTLPSEWSEEWSLPWNAFWIEIPLGKEPQVSLKQRGEELQIQIRDSMGNQQVLQGKEQTLKWVFRQVLQSAELNEQAALLADINFAQFVQEHATEVGSVAKALWHNARFQGCMKMMSGAGEISFATVSAAAMPVLSLPATGLATHGADMLIAGVKQTITGENQDTAAQKLADAMGYGKEWSMAELPLGIIGPELLAAKTATAAGRVAALERSAATAEQAAARAENIENLAARIENAIAHSSAVENVAAHVPPPQQFARLSESELSQLSRAERGIHTESWGAKAFHRVGYRQKASKMKSDNGFDGVFVKTNAAGGVEDVVITESKFNWKGDVRMVKDKQKLVQGTIKWARDRIGKMMEDGNPPDVQETGRFLQEILDTNPRKLRIRVNVMDRTGTNRWYQVDNAGKKLPKIVKNLKDEL